MNFNLDDPLAGILSDGSDDSFFDDDRSGKKKSVRKKSTPNVERKNAIFNLNNETADTKVGNIENRPGQKEEFKSLSRQHSLTDHIFKDLPLLAKPQTSFKRTVSAESIGKNIANITKKSEQDNNKAKSAQPQAADSVLNALSVGNDKSKETKQLSQAKSSQSLLDDILGVSINPPKPKVDKKPLAKIQNIGITKQDIKIDKPKPGGGDWLGLFKDNDVDESKDELPNWLGGTKTKEKSPKSDDKESTSQRQEVEPNDVVTVDPLQDIFIRKPTNVMSTEDIGSEGTNLHLQQQESQLMLALQLKAQEEKLASMQIRHDESAKFQREATKSSQNHVQDIFRKQAEQRQQIQDVIAAQQDRITQRIKALLGPPIEEPVDFDIGKNGEFVETPHMREKKQLMLLIQSLQGNHDKEIDLIETSFRRQITFLEITLSQAEDRMKEESDKLVKFYKEKYSWQEEHHQLYKSSVDENMKSLIERNKVENEILKQQHLDNVRILQEHHGALIENMRNSITQEERIIKDSTGLSASLFELVADVKENKENCQTLVNEVNLLMKNCQTNNDATFKARDDQLREMAEHLKSEREYLEVEKKETRELVKSLEARMKQLTMMMEEETVALRQKRMEFDFEKATFNKQMEFAKDTLRRQNEELKILKEDTQKEFDDRLAKLEEDKLKARKDSQAIIKEKLALQHLREELENMKEELQIQLDEVNEEKTKLNVDKQKIHMEEQRVVAKNRDLELLAKAAMEKQSQADRSIAEAENVQRKYEERITRIQEQVISINAREKQIAKDKVALSRERLSLHNERKELESLRKCSLCKNTPYVTGLLDQDYSVSKDVAPAAKQSDIEEVLARNNMEMREVSEAREPVDSGEDKHDYGSYREYLDPRLMMLRLDVQKVLSNIGVKEQDTKHDSS